MSDSREIQERDFATIENVSLSPSLQDDLFMEASLSQSTLPGALKKKKGIKCNYCRFNFPRIQITKYNKKAFLSIYSQVFYSAIEAAA